MKLLEEIKVMSKDYVYDMYTKICRNFKNYDNVTRLQMGKSILEVYEKPFNIVDMCTEKELKFLQRIIKNNSVNLEKKYPWEIYTLCNKMLLLYDDTSKMFVIPEELYSLVVEALTHVIWQNVRKKDVMNELMISYVKVHGVIKVESFVHTFCTIFHLEFEELKEHIWNNHLFRYYIYYHVEHLPRNETQSYVVYADYFEYWEEIVHGREKYSFPKASVLTSSLLRILFYYPFDIRNPKIRKFYEETKDVVFISHVIWGQIQICALLNLDRTNLKNRVQNSFLFQGKDATAFLKMLDEVLDEMPSGVLKGFTPNEYKALSEM